ncbi:DNA repair protein RecO [Candidatus Rhodoluna planktonica]|uniref:DNA repair protein RecO n=1 Tax=Candidatus Rhodoluna planktonica TaxID=535712 RepID=A0A1D9DYT8_9MICO|nr:DNA repair protein RecO [Candidatus Rhodoluna planktonica]AOY55962.1 DNA repair protein RecO [Candidatus Rhodoluna planktonica]
MPLYKDEAIVLRTHKLGEADRIITFLTRYHGQVRAVAKGVRKTASKFGSRLEPFMAVEVQFYEGKSLDIVNQVEILSAYGKEIVSDYPSYTAASVMVETAEKLTSELSSPQQYLLLVGAIRSLSNRERNPSSTLDSYLLRALAIAGWAPNFELCVGCQKPGPHNAFLLSAGGMVCEDCRIPGSAIVDSETSALLAALLTGDWGTVSAAGESSRASASGIVAAYSQWHIERGLKSLQHLERE